MELLGDRNWWLPRWLDRLLPRIDVEGEARAEGAVAVPATAGNGAEPDTDPSRVPVA
jgi:RND superfamily putative drug exporter